MHEGKFIKYYSCASVHIMHCHLQAAALTGRATVTVTLGTAWVSG